MAQDGADYTARAVGRFLVHESCIIARGFEACATKSENRTCRYFFLGVRTKWPLPVSAKCMQCNLVAKKFFYAVIDSNRRWFSMCFIDNRSESQ